MATGVAAVPAVFIVFATALAPGSKVALTFEQNGRQVTKVVNLAFGAGIHPAFMAPMAITALAALAGMFIILDSRTADRRLALDICEGLGSGSAWSAVRLGAGDLGWLARHLAAGQHAFRRICRLGCRYRPGPPAGLIRSMSART